MDAIATMKTAIAVENKRNRLLTVIRPRLFDSGAGCCFILREFLLFERCVFNAKRQIKKYTVKIAFQFFYLMGDQGI